MPARDPMAGGAAGEESLGAAIIGEPRLPAATRLGRVRLQVADLSRSLAYYESTLGFRAVPNHGEAVALAAEGGDVPLIELHERAGAAPVPHRGRLGLYHFAILLPYRGALARFLAHLTARGERPGASDHLVSEALYLRDPDGLGVEVYADRPRSTWRYQKGELLMDTRPLDIADLVRAGGGAVWQGMPAGTVIGHVHLHVADLDDAAAFYHAALGFDVVVRSYAGALFLSAGGYHHHLGLNTWAGAAAARPQPGDARLLDWEIVVPRPEQAEAAAARLREAGHPVERAAHGWLARDPWGTTLRLSGGAPLTK
ncbi:MAG: VOC family protein [Gemmatimonadetes bacterium]|nr:VOC family protein [Gemmatimonadota bacterium]